VCDTESLVDVLPSPKFQTAVLLMLRVAQKVKFAGLTVSCSKCISQNVTVNEVDDEQTAALVTLSYTINDTVYVPCIL